MMEITKLDGTDERLYPLVGPLVMNPKVLKQNNNYPFRTSESYTWYIAREEKRVVGFVPLEQKKNGYVINNYYIEGKVAPVLEALLKQIAEDTAGSLPLYAVALLDDADVFEGQAFVVEKKWTRYVRMRKG